MPLGLARRLARRHDRLVLGDPDLALDYLTRCVVQCSVDSARMLTAQLTSGVLGGIANAFLYAPVLVWLAEWFVVKRGLASGIM